MIKLNYKVLSSTPLQVMPYHLKIIVFVLFSIFIVGCVDDINNDIPTEKYLVSSEKISEQSAEQLRLFAQLQNMTNIDFLFLHDTEAYKITYNTTYKNDIIIASGMVFLPQTSDEVGMLSYQHGTIIHNDDAPSNGNIFNSIEWVSSTAIASYGFISVLPDYIGFGYSSNIMHPYIVEHLNASSVVDMLKASKELALKKNLNFNKKVFLAGFSEGGYVTMATHKYMEENKVEGFDLIASFPAAGVYDLKGIQEYFFSLETSSYSWFIPYMIQAYKTVFDLEVPLSDLIQDPYASSISNLFDGTKSFLEISGQLTNNISELIAPNLKNHIDTDPNYNELVRLLKENSLTDWSPRVKIYMHHGENDDIIPYQNAQFTYDKFITNGSSPNVITLTKVEGGHIETYLPHIFSLVDVLAKLK